MNSQLIALRRQNILPKELYDKLRSSGGFTHLLYGLPKVFFLHLLVIPSLQLAHEFTIISTAKTDHFAKRAL